MRVFASVVFAMLLATSAVFAKTLKTQFTIEDGAFFITAGHKVTGNGSTFTVCVYFDAETGEFLGQLENPGLTIDTEEELQEFCLLNLPTGN